MSKYGDYVLYDDHQNERRRLIKALRPLAALETRPEWTDKGVVATMGGVQLTAGDARRARDLLRDLGEWPAPPPANDGGWRHIANEWADVATNGLQWLKNVEDGTSSFAEAKAAMQKDIDDVRAMKRPQ